jgi:hypothetical protein
MRMQEIQITRTAENRRLGIRRHALKVPRERPSVMPPPRPKRHRIFPKGPAQPPNPKT